MKQANNYLNEITLGYTKKLFSQTRIKESFDASLLAREIYKNTNSNIDLKEFFFVICLNRANEVIGYHKVSEGGVSGCNVDSKLIFSTALKCLASGIILIHNHPSGYVMPSVNDKELTRKICQGAKLLDIEVLDHLIISSTSFHSLADEGEL